jgi:hypothetical protein
MLPLLILYLANNAVLIRFSQRISRWEGSPVAIGKALAVAAPKAAGTSPKAVGTPPKAANAPKPAPNPPPNKGKSPTGPSPSGKRRRK